MTDQPESASALPIRSSPRIAALVGALAKAQAAFPEILKDQRALIETRSGARYSYAYANLGAIVAAVRPALTQNEIAVLQPLRFDGRHVVVVTLLAHSSGEWLSCELAMPITDPTDARSLASATTYAKRYALASLLAIAPQDDSDDDAAAAVEKKPSAPRKDTPPKSAPPTPAPTPTPLAAAASPTPAPTAADYISDAQRRRLFAIAKDRGWDKDALHAWLIQEGIGSTTKIKTGEYDAVVSMLQRAAP